MGGFLLELRPSVLGVTRFQLSVTDGCTMVRTNVSITAVASDAPAPEAANASDLARLGDLNQYLGSIANARGIDDDDNVDVLALPWKTDIQVSGLPVAGSSEFKTVRLGSSSPSDADTAQEDLDLQWSLHAVAAGPIVPPAAGRNARAAAASRAAVSLLQVGSIIPSSTVAVFNMTHIRAGGAGLL